MVAVKIGYVVVDKVGKKTWYYQKTSYDHERKDRYGRPTKIMKFVLCLDDAKIFRGKATAKRYAKDGRVVEAVGKFDRRRVILKEEENGQKVSK